MSAHSTPLDYSTLRLRQKKINSMETTSHLLISSQSSVIPIHLTSFSSYPVNDTASVLNDLLSALGTNIHIILNLVLL